MLPVFMSTATRASFDVPEQALVASKAYASDAIRMVFILYRRHSRRNAIFCASLTPTLLPRNFLTQGVLSGCSLATGYGIGVFGCWLWAYMELPQPKALLLHVAKFAAAAGCAVVAIICLSRTAVW